MSDITVVLESIRKGDPKGAEELLPMVYEELRRLAIHRMRGEPPGHTLQPTALVHEAWLRVVGDQSPSFDGRAHFFGAAAEAMRRILVESARRKMRLKRGANPERVGLDEVDIPMALPSEEVVALDEALEKLESVDYQAAGMVKLCYFVGLTQEQAAAELGVSLATAERRWAFARAWLFRELRRDPSAPMRGERKS